MDPDSRNRLAKWIDMPRESLWTKFLIIIVLLAMGLPLASSAQQPCIIRVTVLDNEGNPILESKVSVQRKGREPFNATSDAQGLACFPSIPSGSYEVLAEKTGFFPSSQPI